VGQGRNHCCATVKCCSEPLNSIKGSLTDWMTVNFSRKTVLHGISWHF
jgi:hypothetical protein